MSDERRDINLSIEIPLQLDDTLLAWAAFRGPPPELPRIKFTIRQTIRIWRLRRREAIEQWIHDHLQHARCDC